ncbi:MAG: cell division protein FtsZ [Oscillospiraceae bacterium]|nr:cell division protein FtsZ [Oscillospiraceae bacterium]
MANLQFATMELEEPDEFDLEGSDAYDVSIKVVGVGGGGGNALEYMAKNSIDGVEYLAVNTDVPALRSKDKRLMKRLQIGKKRTKGRGAGGNPEVGCESAMEDRQAIETVLDGTSMVFISAGMGGGTGTGAAPVIAEISKSMGILTIGVVTKPFDFERQQKMNTALKGIVEMRKHVDALIIIPNQSLLKINEQAMNAKAAFEMVDDVLYKVVKSISEVLNTTSYMNVDFADLESVLKDSGDAHIAIGEGSGDNKAEDAVQQVINSPLLETSINNAGKMLVHITMSEDTILTDVDSIIAKLTEAAHPDVEVIPGCEIDANLKDTVIVTAVATSFRDDAHTRERSRKSHGERHKSEPIDTGNTQQLKDAQSIFDTPRGEPQLDNYITQTLSPLDDDDPYKDLEEIFRK